MLPFIEGALDMLSLPILASSCLFALVTSLLKWNADCLGASGCSFAISAGWVVDEVWQGDSADTSRSHGSHREPLYGFQGGKVGRANFGEFLALQHSNFSTEN